MQKPLYCELCVIILKCLVPITALFSSYFRNNIVFFGPHCAVKHDIVVWLSHLHFKLRYAAKRIFAAALFWDDNDFTFFFRTKQTSKDAKCFIELCGPKGAILLWSICANSSKRKIFVLKVQVTACHVHKLSIHLYMFVHEGLNNQ